MSAQYAKRFQAVFLCTHVRGPKLSYLAAAKIIKRSKYFVQKWVERYKATGAVDDLPERGKKRATTKRDDQAIVTLFKRNPTLTLRAAKTKLAQKNIHVSLNTIKNRLADAEIKFRSTRSAPKEVGESAESDDYAIPEIRISVAGGPGESTVEYQYTSNSQSPPEVSNVDSDSLKMTP